MPGTARSYVLADRDCAGTPGTLPPLRGHMADLFSIKQTDTTEYEILIPPERTKSGVIFTLAGPEHTKRRSIALQFSRHLRSKVNRTGRLTLDDPETEYERDTDYLVACTLGWKNFDHEGKPFEFSSENARKLYEDRERAWLRSQIQEALNAQENFIVSSTSN